MRIRPPDSFSVHDDGAVVQEWFMGEADDPDRWRVMYLFQPFEGVFVFENRLRDGKLDVCREFTGGACGPALERLLGVEDEDDEQGAAGDAQDVRVSGVPT